MSLRLFEVTDVQTNSTPAESPMRVRRRVVRQLGGPAGVDVAGDEQRVLDLVVADVLEDLAAVVGVAVPLVDVVGDAVVGAAGR